MSVYNDSWGKNLLFLRHAKLLPTSGPLHLLFPLPRELFQQICVASFFSSFRPQQIPSCRRGLFLPSRQKSPCPDTFTTPPHFFVYMTLSIFVAILLCRFTLLLCVSPDQSVSPVSAESPWCAPSLPIWWVNNVFKAPMYSAPKPQFYYYYHCFLRKECQFYHCLILFLTIQNSPGFYHRQ